MSCAGMAQELMIIRIRDIYLERKSMNFLSIKRDRSGLELRKEMTETLEKMR